MKKESSFIFSSFVSCLSLIFILASMLSDNIENNIDGNPSKRNKKTKRIRRKNDILTANIERVCDEYSDFSHWSRNTAITI